MVNWYNTSWSYRKSHTINGASGAGQNYQIPINIHYSSGNDNGINVYLDKQCKPDFSDIRFTGSDGTTQLDYWIETKTIVSDDVIATVWVEVQDDLGNNRTIYLYYGNNDATSQSNGEATFDFFDDFNNLNKWTTMSGTWTAQNSELVGTNDSNVFGIRATSPPSIVNRKIRHRSKTTGTGTICPNISGKYNNASQNLVSNPIGSYSRFRLVSYINGWGTVHDYSTTITLGTYYTYQTNYYGASIKAYKDSTQTHNFTDSSWNQTYTGIAFGCGNTTGGITTDWVFVAKYVDPEPTHSIWGPIELSSDGKLSGLGSKQTIIYSTTDPIIDVESNFNDFSKSAVIENLVIYGNGSNTAIRLQDVSNCQIRNVTIMNCVTGIQVKATSGHYCESNNISHVRMEYVNKGIVFTCADNNTSFSNTVIDNVGISLDRNIALNNYIGDNGVCIQIGDNQNAIPLLNSSIFNAMFWLNAYNGTAVQIYGQFKNGLANLRIEGLGLAMDLQCVNYAVWDNQRFFATYGIGTTRMNNSPPTNDITIIEL